MPLNRALYEEKKCNDINPLSQVYDHNGR